MAALIALATLTALATGVGALPVYWLGDRVAPLRPALWGVVFGVMGVASVQGLLLPGFDEYGDTGVVAGLAAGIAFLLAARALLDRYEVPLTALQGLGARRSILVFLVLFVHSLPEGLALGSAWASETAGLGLFVFLAIAIQNVPEGTAAAIPMREAGSSRTRAFWSATLTSAPQPVGAVFAYLLVEATRSLLGPSFGFAAGAMLALIVAEVIPAARETGRMGPFAASVLVSGGVMVLIGTLLEVG